MKPLSSSDLAWEDHGSFEFGDGLFEERVLSRVPTMVAAGAISPCAPHLV